MVGFNFGCHDTVITVKWIFYLSSSKVEHISCKDVIKGYYIVRCFNNSVINISLTSCKVEHVGLVMISWLMSSCHNKDILNNVNLALKVS